MLTAKANFLFLDRTPEIFLSSLVRHKYRNITIAKKVSVNQLVSRGLARRLPMPNRKLAVPIPREAKIPKTTPFSSRIRNKLFNDLAETRMIPRKDIKINIISRPLGNSLARKAANPVVTKTSEAKTGSITESLPSARALKSKMAA